MANRQLPEKITDRLRIRQLLTRAAEEGAKAQLAVESGDVSYESQVLEREVEKEGIALSLPPKLRGKGEPPQAYLVVVFIRGARALAFNSRRLIAPSHGDPRKELFLALPRQLFLIQRRSEVRIEVSSAYDLSVEFPSHGEKGKRIKRKVIDLSSRGFSFEISSGGELARYPVRAFIKNVALKIHGRTLHFDAQVQNRIPIDAGTELRRCKIGCRFLRIEADDQDFIMALGVTRLAPFLLK